MPNIETPEGDRFWCTEGCGFVGKDHRCEQWGGTIRIPKEAIAAIRAESAALLKMCGEALADLVSVHDEDEGMDDFADDESVGTMEQNGLRVDMPMTFGHLRRARKALAALREAGVLE